MEIKFTKVEGIAVSKAMEVRQIAFSRAHELMEAAGREYDEALAAVLAEHGVDTLPVAEQRPAFFPKGSAKIEGLRWEDGVPSGAVVPPHPGGNAAHSKSLPEAGPEATEEGSPVIPFATAAR